MTVNKTILFSIFCATFLTIFFFRKSIEFTLLGKGNFRVLAIPIQPVDLDQTFVIDLEVLPSGEARELDHSSVIFIRKPFFLLANQLFTKCFTSIASIALGG